MSARTLLVAFALAATALDAPAQAPKARDDASAIVQLALRQPMLVEQVAKLHAQAGSGVLASRAPRALPAAIREFELAQVALLQAPVATDARETYLLARLLWREVRAIAQVPPTLDGAKKLAEITEELEWVASKGAKQVLAQARVANAPELRTAAELALLSQRVAKLQLFRHWGVRGDALALQLVATESDLKRGLERLLAAPANSAELTAELQLAQNQYHFLAQALSRPSGSRPSARELENVVKACDNLLEVMGRVQRLYDAGGG